MKTEVFMKKWMALALAALLTAAPALSLAGMNYDLSSPYLRYPNRLLHMMSRKNLSTFGDGTFGLSALIEADEKEPDNPVKQVVFSQGALNRAYYHLCTGLFVAQMLFAVAACVQALRRRDAAGAPVFIALLGMFLFLCVWETQPRYFFQYQPLLLCAAALLDIPKRTSPE